MKNCKILLFCVCIIVIVTMISALNYAKRLPKTSFRLKSAFAAASSSAVLEKELIAHHPSFDKVDTFSINEYGLKGALYTHKKSGAQVISINAPDENKVFGITFRTPPDDSTGVPHVLEHSVLCGSRKFPVKEPFVDLLKGSLQNFLNAFTYPDRTCYPVASTNTKDFYNLVHVYLDAVLHPRAMSDPQVLQQEGWHYELDDPAGPLSIKGVVYNEMKGVYSSPDSLLGRATQQALFPHNTYGVDSGGDPLRIPDLTFEQFKAFHGSYYHPSNSRVFFYGDDDPLQRLVLLDEYLQEFNRAPVTSQVHYQPKFDKPQRIEVAFPLSPGAEPKHMVTLNWLLNDQPLAPQESMALGVLDYLLLGTSSSALKKALTESSLGESVTGGGLSDELLQSTFSVGLKGVAGGPDIGKVEQLIQATLKQLAEQGFEQEAIQAAMNTYEFRLREFNTGSFPKGLSVMLGMMSQWIYDKSPLDGIQFEAPLKALKADLAAGKPVFQELIRKYLVSNQHCVTVEMKPDLEMEAQRIQSEEAGLAAAKAAMTPEQLAEVVEVSRRLREAQEAVDSPEARATLPKLGLEDIDPLSKELPIAVQDLTREHGATVITHDLQTSGILYADVAFDYSGIEEGDLELLPLFSRMLMEAGTSSYDLTTLTRKIGANTGGIGVSFHNDLRSSAGKVVDGNDVLLYLLIRGKAVVENIPTLFELFSEILLNADFGNQKRAVEMLKESKVRKESAVLSSGHSFAATRLGGRSSFLGYLNEVTGGLTSVRAAGPLLETAMQDWPAISARLERMRAAIVQKGGKGTIVNLTGDSKLLEATMPAVKSFLSTLPGSSAGSSSNSSPIVSRWSRDKLLPMRNEAFSMPSQVNYVVMGGPILQPGDEVKAPYAVAAKYLSTGFLWDQVRVLGGAYGGFGRFAEATGRFVYISYRDPNCINTLNIYDRTPAALSEAEISTEELLQAVIGSVGELDAPLSPDQKGFESFLQHLTGESTQDRQRWRTGILNTQAADFKDFAVHLAKLRETGTIAVFGAQQAIDAANQQLPADRRMVVEQALLSKPSAAAIAAAAADSE